MRFPFVATALLATALTAAAESATNIKAPAAQGIEVYGDLFIKSFGRSTAMNEALDREFLGGNRSDSDTGGYLTARIGLRVLLEKRVSVVLEFENREMNRMGEGTQAVASLWGGEDNLDFDVRFGQAYVNIQDVFIEGLSFRAGIQDFKVDPAGTGNPFFMDLRRSESPFWTSVQEGQLVQGNAAAGFNGLLSTDGLFKDRQYDAGGFKIGYALNENVEVSSFLFTTFEGGPAHDDQLLYGARFDMNFLDKDKPSNLVLIATMFTNGGNRHRVLTYGGGTGVRFKDFTFHLEGYGQFGEFGEFDSGADEDVERQVGWAGILGVYYRPEVSMEAKDAKPLTPFFSVSGRILSGDDGQNAIADGTGTSPRSRKNRDFISMEGNNELMILEDDVLGLDVDSNYASIRVGGGVRLSLLSPADFEVGATYAYNRCLKTVNFGIGGADSWKTLGHEVDVKLRWHQSELVTFATGFGLLWDADHFGTRKNSVDDLGFRTGNTRMWMWTFEVGVTF
ncbi:MAG: hypothetical protein FD180_30 [Planctomycetota bacterium]|nr:MAG: hypothetical protein FD180_30 [Planctomycetota bacterium]